MSFDTAETMCPWSKIPFPSVADARSAASNKLLPAWAKMNEAATSGGACHPAAHFHEFLGWHGLASS